MIPNSIVQQVLEEANIEQVVRKVVTLKKAGANFVGKCPFHDEKTPSFSVSPARGIFKCFGCGKGGDAAKFIMETEGKTFPEAIKQLAAELKIIIEEKEPDPEQEKIDNLREQLINFNEFALQFYKEQLQGEALEYAKSRMGEESIGIWEIGYAPSGYGALVAAAKKAGYLEEFILTTGLIRQHDKTHQLYDFFYNRLIFPIRDDVGRLISFTGRAMPGTPEASSKKKYINLPDTSLYSKSHVLYGLHLGRAAVRKSSTAIIVEGNTDVITLHNLNLLNTVAASGTSLTEGHLKLLKRYCNSLIIMGDGDKAGNNANIFNSKRAIEMGFFVNIVTLPEGKDPDDAFQDEQEANSFINNNKVDFITWYATELTKKAGEDPLLKNEAIKELADMVKGFDSSTREIYIDLLTGRGKLKAKLLRDRLRDIDKQTAPREESEKDYSLPSGVDAAEFDRWGFYEYKNEYYFRTKSGHEKLSNFVMHPIFHINSIFESKRIYEIVNVHGYRIVGAFDMQEMTSLQAFQRNVEGKGNFLFWGIPQQFNKLKLKLYEQTRTCEEIRFLGWQKEGFWAWANGIINKDASFQEIDEYGVIEHDKRHYFIPAFSQIYINDKSIFIDQRKFLYKTRQVELEQWSKMFISVFGDNAVIGIAYWIAAIFRDVILHIFKNFPLLNLFGPKGTGKSQMAMSLSCLFGEAQTPFNIHNGTMAGFAAHVETFRNAFSWIDEYKNSLEFTKIETLKSIYDSHGRSRMNMDKGKKKEVTEVNSAVILSGQEMPTADIALFSRVIFLRFMQTEFTDQEKKNYDVLKETERDGLSHLTTEIVKHREYFQKEFYDNYNETLSDFNNDLADSPVEDRILRSMVSIVAAWRTISKKITFPFDYNKLRKIAIEAIETQHNQVSQSNELGQFWSILEALFDDNQLIEDWHFRIDFTEKLELTDKEINLKPAIAVLKFKYNAVYTLYATNARRQGLKPMPSDTLMYYLKNHKTFVGVQKACVFKITMREQASGEIHRKRQNTSAFCFDYKMLKVNLTREFQDLPEIVTAVNGSQNTKANGAYRPETAKPIQKQTSLPLTKNIGPTDDLPF